jgi:hypothetical protein
VSDAVVFISHFRVKPGHEAAFRTLWSSAVDALETAKPRTTAFLGYLAEDASALTIVHLFGDAGAMAAHVEGADDRSAAAYEHIEPAGWEVYGAADPAALEGLRAAAAGAGVPLRVEPTPLGGFVRVTPGG